MKKAFTFIYSFFALESSKFLTLTSLFFTLLFLLILTPAGAQLEQLGVVWNKTYGPGRIEKIKHNAGGTYTAAGRPWTHSTPGGLERCKGMVIEFDESGNEIRRATASIPESYLSQPGHSNMSAANATFIFAFKTADGGYLAFGVFRNFNAPTDEKEYSWADASQAASHDLTKGTWCVKFANDLSITYNELLYGRSPRDGWQTPDGNYFIAGFDRSENPTMNNSDGITMLRKYTGAATPVEIFNARTNFLGYREISVMYQFPDNPSKFLAATPDAVLNITDNGSAIPTVTRNIVADFHNLIGNPGLTNVTIPYIVSLTPAPNGGAFLLTPLVSHVVGLTNYNNGSGLFRINTSVLPYKEEYHFISKPSNTTFYSPLLLPGTTDKYVGVYVACTGYQDCSSPRMYELTDNGSFTYRLGEPYPNGTQLQAVSKVDGFFSTGDHLGQAAIAKLSTCANFKVHVGSTSDLLLLDSNATASFTGRTITYEGQNGTDVSYSWVLTDITPGGPAVASLGTTSGTNIPIPPATFQLTSGKKKAVLRYTVTAVNTYTNAQTGVPQTCQQTQTVIVNIQDYPENIVDADCFIPPPAQAWTFQQAAEATGNVHNYISPLAGDIDNDSIVEIICAIPNGSSNTNGEGVYIYKGNDLSTRQSLNTVHFNARAGCPYAICRWNNVTYLIVPGIDHKLWAYSLSPFNTTRLWESTVNYHDTHTIVNVSFVDFNHDGKPEILVAGKIFDINDGSLIAAAPSSNIGLSTIDATAATPTADFYMARATAADVDGDGEIEYVAGNRVYSVNVSGKSMTKKYEITGNAPNDSPGGAFALGDGQTQTVDWDGDGQLDIVVMRGDRDNGKIYIYVWSVKSPLTGTLKAYHATGQMVETKHRVSFSLPMLGDIDGDKRPEMVFVSEKKLNFIKHNDAAPGKLVHTHITSTDVSGFTGATLFDFNQDTHSEIVYRDEDELRVINGQTMVNLEKLDLFSATWGEYPIVVDMDNDGAAEILVTGRTSGKSHLGTLRVYKATDPQKPWAPARKVWNQYCYNPVYVNDNLTIPEHPFNPATKFPGEDGILGNGNDIQPFNNCLQQSTKLNKNGEMLWLTPNAQIVGQPAFIYDAVKDSLTIKLKVTNAGDAVIKAPFKITVHKNNIGNATRYTYSYPSQIAIGETVEIVFGVVKFKQYWVPFDDIIIRINDSGNGTNDQPVCSSSLRDYHAKKMIASDDRVLVLQGSLNNLIPVTVNDIKTCSTPGSFTIAVLSTSPPSPKHGTASISDSLISYTPSSFPSPFIGWDTLQYTITCGGEIDTATVYIHVVPKPDNIVDADCYTDPPAGVWSIKQYYKSEFIDTEKVFEMSVPLVGDIDDDGSVEIVCAGKTPDHTNYSSDKILVFDAKAKNLKYSFPVQKFYAGFGTIAMADVNNDGKAEIFVAACDKADPADRGRIHCYKYNSFTGNYEWSWRSDPYTATPISQSFPYLNIADFNADGIPEIMANDKIFNAQTGKLILDCNLIGQTDKDYGYGGGHMTAGATQAYHKGVFSSIADMDNDGLLELVAGRNIYKITITNTAGETGNNCSILRSADPVGLGVSEHGSDGYTAVADLNLDGYLDVVVIRHPSHPSAVPPNNADRVHTYMYAWDGKTGALLHDNKIRLTTPLPGGWNWGLGYPNYGGSIPFIGDLDGDGVPEIAFSTMLKLHAYKYNKATGEMKPMWMPQGHLATEDVSACTTLTLFDFNQDNKMELVYRDQTRLRIIDGATGTTMTSIPCHSWTMNEYPVVADIDGDGSANIIVLGKSTPITGYPPNGVVGPASGDGELFIFESDLSKPNATPWAPARAVWNQWGYSAVNINENLTVPRYRLNPATVFPGKDGQLGTADDIRPFNGFLMQQTALDKNGVPLWLTPNAAIATVLSKNYFSTGDSLVITVKINNIGDAALQAPYYISAYKNSVSSTTAIAVDSVMTPLNVGDTDTVKLVIRNFHSKLPVNKIFVRVNDKGKNGYIQTECKYGENEFEINTKLLIARNDYITTEVNTPVIINPFVNDSLGVCVKGPGMPFDTIAGSGLRHGSLQINTADTTLLYTPDPGFIGIDSLAYYIKCGADSSVARIYIAVYKPLASQYFACQGAKTYIGFKHSNLTFDWYATETGGSPTGGTNKDSIEVTKNGTPVQTWWAEINYKGKTFPRLKVELQLANDCNIVTPTACAATGSLLFLEDFGGNEESDPDRPTVAPTLAGTVLNHTFSPSGTPNDGYYAVAKTTAGMFPSGWYTMGDHTFPGNNDRGYAMIVNASQTAGAFYRTTVSGFCAGSELYFSAWIANLCTPAYELGGSNKPELRFVLQDASTGVILVDYNTAAIPTEPSATWKLYGFNYTATTTNPLTLTVYNKKAGGGTPAGNDFAIDDISVRLCVPPVTVTQPVTSDTTVCTGSPLTLRGSYTDDSSLGANLKYRWEYSLTGNVNNPAAWSPLGNTEGSTTTGSLTSNYVINKMNFDSAGYYRLWVAASGTNLTNTPNCRAISRIIRVRVSQRMKPADMRIHILPAASPIHLSSYLDTTNYSYGVQWKNIPPAPPFVAPTATTTGTLNVSGWPGSVVYTYRYVVTTPQCGSDSAKVYIHTLSRQRLKTSDTIYICKSMSLSAFVQINQIIGMELPSSTWSYPNDPGNITLNNTTLITSGKHAGGRIFNAVNAYNTASPAYDYGSGRKKFEFQYSNGTMVRRVVLIVFE